MIRSTMQKVPLSLNQILERAGKLYPQSQIVSRLPDKSRKVHTFAVSPNMVAPLLAALAILVAASILYGYITILVIIVAYVIHIPFAIRTRRLVPVTEIGLMLTPESRRICFLPPLSMSLLRNSIRRAQSAVPCSHSMPA